MARLAAYDWPGNVRGLQNEIQRMLVRGTEGRRLGVEVLSLMSWDDLRWTRAGAPKRALPRISVGLTGDLKERVSAMEARIIRETLIRYRWNKSQTARELGLSRVGLRAKLERYGLENVHPLAPARRGGLRRAQGMAPTGSGFDPLAGAFMPAGLDFTPPPMISDPLVDPRRSWARWGRWVRKCGST
jgi:hypothetical protein